MPDLGYLLTDQPYPRGELCIKTRRLIPGYYKNPEATRGLFDDEGYMLTGDIVEQRGPEEVTWIDRRKNILKLSQGEFVSISRLEELYKAGSPFIQQVFIHGSSLHAYLLAVIVPEGTTDKEVIRAELGRIAAREGLRGVRDPARLPAGAGAVHRGERPAHRERQALSPQAARPLRGAARAPCMPPSSAASGTSSGRSGRRGTRRLRRG